jgi:hypothetical protein
MGKSAEGEKITIAPQSPGRPKPEQIAPGKPNPGPDPRKPGKRPPAKGDPAYNPDVRPAVPKRPPQR